MTCSAGQPKNCHGSTLVNCTPGKKINVFFGGWGGGGGVGEGTACTLLLTFHSLGSYLVQMYIIYILDWAS